MLRNLQTRKETLQYRLLKVFKGIFWKVVLSIIFEVIKIVKEIFIYYINIKYLSIKLISNVCRIRLGINENLTSISSVNQHNCCRYPNIKKITTYINLY